MPIRFSTLPSQILKSFRALGLATPFLLTACAPAGQQSLKGNQLDGVSQIYQGQLLPKSSDLRPSMVHLQIMWGHGITGCTGTLIADDLVLTAGHCVIDLTTSINVQLYKDASHVVESIPASSWVMNPDYVPTGGSTDARPTDPKAWRKHLDHERLESLRAGNTDPIFNLYHFTHGDGADVGLVKLSRPVSAKFRPLRFSRNLQEIELLGSLHIIGAGQSTVDYDHRHIGILRETWGTVLGWNGEKSLVTMINENGKATCAGDSGGSVVQKQGNEEVLVGLVSRGDCEEISMMIPTAKYANWIDGASRHLK